MDRKMLLVFALLLLAFGGCQRETKKPVDASVKLRSLWMLLCLIWVLHHHTLRSTAYHLPVSGRLSAVATGSPLNEVPGIGFCILVTCGSRFLLQRFQLLPYGWRARREALVSGTVWASGIRSEFCLPGHWLS